MASFRSSIAMAFLTTGAALAAPHASAAPRCTQYLRGPRVIFRGDPAQVRYRVCAPGTARLFVIGTTAPPYRGAVHQRRTVRIAASDVGTELRLVFTTGAAPVGGYRLAMLAPDGARLHSQQPLTIRYAGRPGATHECGNRLLMRTRGPLHITRADATGISCAHAETIMRAVASWLDPTQASDLGAFRHPVTDGYYCAVMTSPPRGWSISCRRGSRALEGFAATERSSG